MGMEQQDPYLGLSSPEFERKHPQLIDSPTASLHEADSTPEGLALVEDVFRNEPDQLELNVSMALALAARHAPNALATNNDVSVLGTPSQLLYQNILAKLVAPDRSDFPAIYNKLLRKLTPPTSAPDQFSHRLRLHQLAREEYFTLYHTFNLYERMKVRARINVTDLSIRDSAERHVESWCQDLVGRDVSMPLTYVIPSLYLEFGDPDYLKAGQLSSSDARAPIPEPRTAIHPTSCMWFIDDHRRLEAVLNDITVLESELFVNTMRIAE
jgi:hypothetical protein